MLPGSPPDSVATRRRVFPLALRRTSRCWVLRYAYPFLSFVSSIYLYHTSLSRCSLGCSFYSHLVPPSHPSFLHFFHILLPASPSVSISNPGRPHARRPRTIHMHTPRLTYAGGFTGECATEQRSGCRETINDSRASPLFTIPVALFYLPVPSPQPYSSPPSPAGLRCSPFLVFPAFHTVGAALYMSSLCSPALVFTCVSFLTEMNVFFCRHVRTFVHLRCAEFRLARLLVPPMLRIQRSDEVFSGPEPTYQPHREYILAGISSLRCTSLPPGYYLGTTLLVDVARSGIR
jgi:hypothetical protein